MKYLKFVYTGFIRHLTINEIYKVISYDGINVTIHNDIGEEISLLRICFVDVTAEVRNNRINSILR